MIPVDPVGRPLLDVLAMVAEFESELIKTCICKDLVAQAAGPLRGRTAGTLPHPVAVNQLPE